MLELPKFTPTSDNVSERSPLDRWLYFLRHAEDLEADELSQLLVEAEYHEATEVLQMISRSPEERRFYEARQKFLHDEEARLAAAREQGRNEGIEQGAVIGKIQLLQQLLNAAEQPAKELGKLDQNALLNLLSDLQERLRSRDS